MKTCSLSEKNGVCEGSYFNQYEGWSASSQACVIDSAFIITTGLCSADTELQLMEAECRDAIRELDDVNVKDTVIGLVYSMCTSDTYNNLTGCVELE